jgi:two-component system chemotaxis response regulator CheY
MEEILKLVKQTDTAMDAFSEARNESLHEAENQTRVGLEGLRAAAAFAAKQSREMDAIMVKMQSKSAQMSSADSLLEASSDRRAAILTPLELLRHEMETDQPRVGHSYDAVNFTLCKAGYEVVEAVDGKDGLGKTGTGKFDLIITDLNMPKMDRIQMITAVRKLPGYAFIPILMLTTESQAEKKNAGRKAGATGWIVKPFDTEKLLAVIHKLVK